MTIHHDKLAYGKLASNMEELSAEKLDEMLKLLNEEQEEEDTDSLKEDEKKQKKL